MQMDFANHRLDMSRCHVMGVLNATPDSFSDGGRFSRLDAALGHALQMVSEGAAFIDVGGESTRPGAQPVPLQEELDRVCPVIEAIHAEMDVAISVDTSAPEVMEEAVRLGAGLINDVRALRQPGALEAAVASGVPVCLMHMQGQPGTMQAQPLYSSVSREVGVFLMERVRLLEEAGMPPDRILLDPGFGFGKSLAHNLELLDSLEQLQTLGYPLLVGMSRKSMLGHITGRDVLERLPAGLAAATIAAMKGASIIRVHDVKETVDAVKVVSAMKEARA
ncbi:MAG: dihydropteroate synthase [Oleiphilaceae bacterium]|nr:dihydropteroate synthase [Oleiphilaceae bacterium]